MVIGIAWWIRGEAIDGTSLTLKDLSTGRKAQGGENRWLQLPDAVVRERQRAQSRYPDPIESPKTSCIS